MALWNKIFGKKDEESGKLNPIVQKSPPPVPPPRVSSAKPAAKPEPEKPRHKPSSPSPKVEEPLETKGRKKKEEKETGTHTKSTDDAAFLKRGIARQQKGEHDA